MVTTFRFSSILNDVEFLGDLTDECPESGNGTEPKSIVRSNSKSIGGGGSTRDPSRKGERPEKPVKDQDKVNSCLSHPSLNLHLAPIRLVPVICP